MTDDLTARARELAHEVLGDCTSIIYYGYSGADLERDYDEAAKIITAALRAERKRAKAEALEAAERECREYAGKLSIVLCQNVAIECADRIAGLVQRIQPAQFPGDWSDGEIPFSAKKEREE